MYNEDMNRESVIQERVNLLKDQGYRGFRLSKGHQKAEESFEVAAVNKKGLILTADGDTLDESYENLIEKIDYTLDDLK